MSEQANMRIVCTTERAFDNTTAILDFLGSGEYAINKETKTLELNVSSWDYYRLIDIIHKQFTEELGERAWRKEIDIFHINEGGSDYKIEKSPKQEKPEKRVLHFIFGELATKHIDDFDELLDDLKGYEGTYIIREFKTAAEEEAYIQALEDFDGWNEWQTLESYHDDSEIEAFDKRYEEEMEENDEPEHLGCYAYHVETDRNGKKQIHIDGYCYWNGESYQCVQGTGCYIPFDELHGDIADVVDKAFEDTKQYQGEITKDGVRKYYEGAVVLPIGDVTQDTPDGWYIN